MGDHVQDLSTEVEALAAQIKLRSEMIHEMQNSLLLQLQKTTGVFSSKISGRRS